MTSRQNVYALAKTYGAKITELSNGDIVEVCAVAPDGYHWMDSGTFELVWSDSDGTPKAEAWQDLLGRMAGGLEPCNECCGHAG